MKVWEYIYERVRLGELEQLNENFEKCGLGIYASLFTGMTPRNDELKLSNFDGNEQSLNDLTFEDRKSLIDDSNHEFGNANWLL